MAALTIAPGDVIPGDSAQVVMSKAGVAIAAGESIYLDEATNTMKLADASVSALTAIVKGIAISNVVAGQWVTYVRNGPIVLGSGLLLAGKCYILGDTAGSINPMADLATGWRGSLIGYALTTSILQVSIINTSVVAIFTPAIVLLGFGSPQQIILLGFNP